MNRIPNPAIVLNRPSAVTILVITLLVIITALLVTGSVRSG